MLVVQKTIEQFLFDFLGWQFLYAIQKEFHIDVAGLDLDLDLETDVMNF